MRVAVVGLGYWGPNIARNLCKLLPSNHVVGCDLVPERLEAARLNTPQIELTDSFEGVLARDDVDAVVLATPVPSHYPMARQALEAGKHVLVEKPLADGIGPAEELTALAASKDLVLMTGHTFLFSPPVVAIKQLIEDDVLGDIHYVQSSRVNLGIHQAESSVIWDLAPHDFSIIFWWLDEYPESISSCARDSLQRNVPDVAFVDLLFGSGRVANAHLSWLAPTKVRRMTVVGSKRMVLYEDTNPQEPVKVFDMGVDLEPHEDFGQYKLTYRTGDVVSPRMEAVEPLQQELAHFLECITNGTEPRGGRDLPVAIVRALAAADASAGRGGHMVSPDDVRKHPSSDRPRRFARRSEDGELVLAGPRAGSPT